MKDTALVYYRVSKKTTRENIETQKERMAPWLEELKQTKGYEIPEAFIFEEEKSGEEIEKRPKFMKVLDLLEKGQAQIFIVYMVDRIGRFKERAERNEVMQLIIDKKIRVETLYHGSFDPENEDQMDELEKLLTDARRDNRWRATRIKDGLAKSSWHGPPPYGVRWIPGNEFEKGRYEINEVELNTLREIVKLLCSGYGAQNTTKILNSDLKKYPARKGGPWEDCTIHGILSKDFYFTGLKNTVHGPVDIKVGPLFTEQEIREVRHEMAKRRKREGPGITPENFLLQGLAHCGECGYRLGIQEQGRERFGIYRYYRCRKFGKGECTFRAMDADWLDLVTWQGFAATFSDLEELERVVERQELLPNEDRKRAEELFNAASKTLEKLEQEKERLDLGWIKGRIDEEFHVREGDRIKKELEEAEATKRKAERTMSRPAEMEKAIREASEEVIRTMQFLSEFPQVALTVDRKISRTKFPGVREIKSAKTRKKVFEMQRAILNKYVASTGNKIVIHQEHDGSRRSKPTIKKIEIGGIIMSHLGLMT